MGLVVLIYFLLFFCSSRRTDILRCFVSFYSPNLWAGLLRRRMGNMWIAEWGRERELHLVLNVWWSGLGRAWRSIGCDWYNFSPLKSSCGDCCHVPTLEWNNVPRGPALHPNAFVTLWACMRHPSQIPVQSLVGCLVTSARSVHSGQTEPQIEKTEEWEECAVKMETRTEWLRQRQTEGYRGVKAGSWSHWGSVLASGSESCWRRAATTWKTRAKEMKTKVTRTWRNFRTTGVGATRRSLSCTTHEGEAQRE